MYNQGFRQTARFAGSFFLTCISVSVIIFQVKQRRSHPLLTLRTCPSGSIMTEIIFDVAVFSGSEVLLTVRFFHLSHMLKGGTIQKLRDCCGKIIVMQKADCESM